MKKLANANIQSEKFGFDGSRLRIFGREGFKTGKNWAVNAMGGSMMVEIDPSPVKEKIEQLINTDITNGAFDKIDHVSINPNILLCLYLEGALPMNSIQNVEDGEGEVIFYEVPLNTSLGVKNFTIKVSEEVEIATIDAQGFVV